MAANTTIDQAVTDLQAMDALVLQFISALEAQITAFKNTNGNQTQVAAIEQEVANFRAALSAGASFAPAPAPEAPAPSDPTASEPAPTA